MDSYSGSIDDPVSLHKYLYANANPVSNSDPSGYSTLADMNTSMGIQGILSNVATPNGKALFDAVMGVFGVANDVISTIREGKAQGLSSEEIAANIAAGLLTSLVTNFSCLITSFYPPVGYMLMGAAALVVGLVAVSNFADGNTEMGIAQVINLVSIVFHMFNPTCFTGDTEVYTDDGFVCIEEIEVGDEVWAYNSETGEIELKEVLNVWIKETDEILHVSTDDGETIDTTTNHPFYVENKGWVAAGDLEVGDILVTADGDTVEVSDIAIEKLAEPIIVYNLEVEDFHTYFVGEFGVLVHNNCFDASSAFSDKKVPPISGANVSNSRGLNKIEKQNLFDIIEQIIPASKGDVNAKTYLKKMGDHLLTGNYKGWNSVYLSPNAGADNIMRFLYKILPDGTVEFMIRQWH